MNARPATDVRQGVVGTTGRLVEARGLGARYGRQVVLQDVHLGLAPGDEVSLIGRSGSGKTTLLLALAGLLDVEGSVRWPGLPGDPLDRRAATGVVFQAPSLVPELSALENVVLPLRLRGYARGRAYAVADSALRELELGEASSALPGELSGGQQQRVGVARVLAGDPRLVMADEPTGALDAATGASVVAALRRHVARVDGALLLATHDEGLADLLPQRLTMPELSRPHVASPS